MGKSSRGYPYYRKTYRSQNGKRKRRICETIRRTREKRGATYLKRKTRLSASSISFSRIGMDYKVDLSLSIDMAGIRKGG
jgi:hypothetical protein